MLSQEKIDAFKKAWYSFEDIRNIQEWLKNIEDWEIYTQKQVKNYIDNELFGKYKTLCTK
jgi:hypothetical protein